MNIVLLGKIAANAKGEIEARLRGRHTLTAVPDVSRLDEFAAELAAAEILVGWPLTNKIAARCSNLRLMQVSGAGIDGLVPEDLPPQVRVANTFHHEAAIAEYVVMMMLMLAREPHRYDARLRGGDWRGSCIWGEPPVLRELRGAEVLVIGTGHIARELVRRLRPFETRITGVSRDPSQPRGDFDRLIGWPEWEQPLATADFVIPACPLTPETEGLIGARTIAQMKPAAYLINITRGKVFDEEALYRALLERRIAGAAIDVWYQYPREMEERRMPSRFPFHELDNVILSPHHSGWTQRTIASRIEDIAENINRLAEGQPLRNQVR